MKTNILYLALVIFIISCGAPDQKAELEKLKSERAELDAKIMEIEGSLSKTDTTNKIKKVEIAATPLKAQSFKTYIEIQGRIDADENVAVSTELPGTITKINVKIGQEVKKGQILAETDARAYQQQYAAMQTNVALATQTYERTKNLWDQKIGTEMQFLQARTGKEAAEAGLAGIQEQIRMSKIISPIDGTVDNINIKIGQAVAPGVPAINVINFANLKIKADVAESYAARVKTGNEVLVVFPDMNDSIRSKIHYASRSIEPLSRTFNVEVNLDNRKEYHPNMVAKLKINDYQSAKPTLVLPVRFIQKGTAESYVLIAENGRAVKKVVKLSREYNGMAEVTEGVKEGDLLITEGYDLVNDGDEIIVRK